MKAQNLNNENIINLLDDDSEEEDKFTEEITLSKSYNNSISSVQSLYDNDNDNYNILTEDDVYKILDSFEIQLNSIKQGFQQLKLSIKNYFNDKNYKKFKISDNIISKKIFNAEKLLTQKIDNPISEINNNNSNYIEHFFDYQNFTNKKEKIKIKEKKESRGSFSLINSEKSWILKDYIPPKKYFENNLSNNTIKNPENIFETHHKQFTNLNNPFIISPNALEDLYDDDINYYKKYNYNIINNKKIKQVINLNNDYKADKNNFIGKKRQ